jgi:hypothetical protein
VELPQNRIEIFIDVCVIVLEIVENQRTRPVMNELRPLVEEGRVVLVGLDDEAVAAAISGRHAEVGRNTTDQEAGLQAGVLQYPGQQARGRRLAMGPGHG